MSCNCECGVQYIPYKEIVKQRALEYYYKNKEKIKEKAKIKYDSLTIEQKKKKQEYNKEWFNKLPIERQNELRESSRQYRKNRYHNLMIAMN